MEAERLVHGSPAHPRTSIFTAVRRAVASTPLVGPFLRRLYHGPFRSSGEYWEKRYRRGDHSGLGSFGRLAEFKAEFLNRFVIEHQIESVIEWGCGDGHQLMLAQYPAYLGVDVSPKAIELCGKRFAGDGSKSFARVDGFPSGKTADLSLSLDVIYHLTEDDVYENYMRQLFDSSRRFVIIYSSNEEAPSPAAHVRHRQFTQWIERHRRDWQLHSLVKNPYHPGRKDGETSFCDFYVFASGI